MNDEDFWIICAGLCRINWLRPGETPSKPLQAIATFHLNSIKAESPADTPSQWSVTLGDRLSVWMEPPGNVRWMGDPLDSMPTAHAILDSGRCLEFSEDYRIKLSQFYGGGQWDDHVLSVRMGRPSLVINMLPRLVALAVDASRAQGLPDLSPEQMQRLWVLVTARNADAQRLYNYMSSSLAEIVATTVLRQNFAAKASE